MIRGFCLGGGLLTALQADIRIASDDSQFGIPAARLGLGSGFAGVTALVDLVGPAWAAEILFSARRFPAAEALQMGLVNQVVPADGPAGRGDEPGPGHRPERAADGRRVPRRRSARRASPRTSATWPGSRRWSRPASAPQDYLEGQRAFAEKRQPAFTGR